MAISPLDKTLDRFWAGGFLYDPEENRVFLHKRDGNTKINPNKWAFFGGLNEGDETFSQCFLRELEEEAGFRTDKDKVLFLREYLNEELRTYRVVFYVQSYVDPAELSLGEGAGFDWVPLERLGSFDLTTKTRDDLDFFIASRQ